MTANVALLGYGLAGSVFHAPFISTTPGLRLSVVVTGNEERREQVSANTPELRSSGLRMRSGSVRPSSTWP